MRPTGRPSLALSAAIAVAVLCLIVEEDLLRRKRQVDPVRRQLMLDRGQYAVARIESIGALGQCNPPSETQVDGGWVKIHQQDVWRGFREDSFRPSYRLKNDPPCAIEVVAIADADVVFEPTMVERGIHHNRAGEQLGVWKDHAPAIIGANERRSRLNILDRAFMRSGDI